MFEYYRRFALEVLTKLPQNRLLSLDVFRGLTITAMVLVNNPGSWSYVYEPMAHAKWHGWTPTDLIFPFFIFIIGISIAIVMSKHEPNSGGDSHSKKMLNATIRGIKLFALGLFLAIFYYDFSATHYSWFEQQVMSIRIMGVLQRLGLVFILTMFVVLYFSRVWRGIIMLVLLIGYWAALMFVPYGDAALGVFQGQLEFGNNLTAWLDHQIFSAKHLYYQDATPFAFDPEGILSTFPAVAGGLAGVFTGELLLNKRFTIGDKIKYLLLTGIACLLLANFWSILLPINKSIWTSSYVLLATGWALIVLAVLAFVIDYKGYRLWTAPFVIFGANAIAFYLFSAMLARLFIMVPMGDTSVHGWLYSELFQPLFGNYFGSLMFAVMFCGLCFIAMNFLYSRKIFFKV